jgi:hypothetical protein
MGPRTAYSASRTARPISWSVSMTAEDATRSGRRDPSTPRGPLAPPTMLLALTHAGVRGSFPTFRPRVRAVPGWSARCNDPISTSRPSCRTTGDCHESQPWLLIALLGVACVATTTTTRTYGGPAKPMGALWPCGVDQETVRRQQDDPPRSGRRARSSAASSAAP